MQAMYHFRIKVDPAFRLGRAGAGARDHARRDEGADQEQALSWTAPLPVPSDERGASRLRATRTMLETRDLTIRFGGHVAVDHVSCAFEPGTLTAIVGPNGAGKTTYFNLISGQLPRDHGQVLLNGQDITGLRHRAHAPRPRPRVPADQLFPDLTVLENVRLAVQAASSGKAAWTCSVVARPHANWLDGRVSISRRVRLARPRRRRRGEPAARRPAQARGGDPDGAGARRSTCSTSRRRA